MLMPHDEMILKAGETMKFILPQENLTGIGNTSLGFSMHYKLLKD